MSGADRPVIGVTTARRKSRIAWFFDWLAVKRAGGRPLRIHPGMPRPRITALDGLVIGGGDDIGAELYGGQVMPDIRIDPDRDALEQALLAEALPRGIPVLGICRGAQMLNVHLGGGLHGEIRTAFPKLKRRPRTPLPRLKVLVEPDTRLARIIGTQPMRVNVLHHQAVDRLGRDLAVNARDRDDIVQGVERPDGPFLIGVQWHPEFLVLSRRQQRLFRSLVDAARRFRDAQPRAARAS
jgi:putative glutamine amidotransferase